MDEKESTSCPLMNIVRTLRSIPDRGKPCDREVTDDGTEILLYRQVSSKWGRKGRKAKKGRGNQKKGKKL